MNPKKSNSTSSESSSSSSSNSSSSSTSSSGSESSSSDSDGTSSSQNSTNEKVLKKNKQVPTVRTRNKSTDDKKEPTKTSGKITPKKGSAIYSSESEESNVTKPSPVKRRLSNTKPKVSATVSVQQKNSLKGNVKNKESVQKNSEKGTTKSKESQKGKAKSIFSPYNSSESDSGKVITKSKNTKTNVSSRSKHEPQPIVKKEEKRLTRSSASSASASTSQSSGSSDSSSESDASDNSSSTNGKVKSVTSSDKKQNKLKSSPSKNVLESKYVNNKSKASESEPITRKLTRSTSARKSVHLLGKIGSDTESESESKSSRPGGKRGVGPKGPIQRTKLSSVKNSTASNKSSETEVVSEERRCPVENCDSNGHLSGKHEKHFTKEACPLYHNKTIEECKRMLEERRKKEEERKRAMSTRKSPKGHHHHHHHHTTEQRSYHLMVMEERNKFIECSPSDIRDLRDREPVLNGIASDYDLKLFLEAQSVASEKIENDLQQLPNVKITKQIEMGKHDMEVWYQSPYPDDYAKLPKLYLCEFCLRYMKSKIILKRHVAKCVWRHPPGEEIYRKDKLSVWEVDGKRYKQYCQNLCLLAKFFLDHKTLYYDVEPFLFYVMTIGDSEGCHTVGYFSKEKNSFLNYNVSCILTLPPYQRQGYGRLLIDFSYLLTREEGKIGSPEKPLSDLGLISYRSYWKDVLLEYLCNFGGKEISIKDISQEMAINSYDIVSTLQALGMMKYWKGKHIILKKPDVIAEYLERVKRRNPVYKEIDKNYLKWAPFIPPQPQSSA